MGFTNSVTSFNNNFPVGSFYVPQVTCEGRTQTLPVDPRPAQSLVQKNKVSHQLPEFWQAQQKSQLKKKIIIKNKRLEFIIKTLGQ